VRRAVSEKAAIGYVRSTDEGTAEPVRHPVIVVGAGPVGLCAAIDLALGGVRVVLLDEDDTASVGSRAICFAKRTLEILDRIGCGDAVVARGVSWNLGKVFCGDDLVYTFDLLPERGHRRPAFINLQQYLLEEFLIDRAREVDGLSLRWKNRVVGIDPSPDSVLVEVETPSGRYRLVCDYLIACDGARSPLRAMLGLEPRGQTFKDRFLISDVRMHAGRSTERWFWFDPPFHRNQSALLHRQADDVWRCDFQLGWEADPMAEKAPERVIPRVRALLGDGVDFELEWVSVYTFACQRLERFRHGRVLFAGDSAHLVSPFGARGANSGIQDAENLAWKLRMVLRGAAPDALLDTYDDERVPAADDNIRNSTRSTDFITPKSDVSRRFRDAVLALAKDHPFARRLVNSGRLSVPFSYAQSPLCTPDADAFAGAMTPGSPAADAPVRSGDSDSWLLAHLGGEFTGVYASDGGPLPPHVVEDMLALERDATPLRTLVMVPARAALHAGARPELPAVEDVDGLFALRYDARPGTYYIVRPDQHVCARRRSFDAAWARAAVARATCRPVHADAGYGRRAAAVERRA
jgi:3-(3-hydroxy-phenyl)propionate hydroxylase